MEPGIEAAESWISCSASYGGGGLGRHLQELVESERQAGRLRGYICSRPLAGDEAMGVPMESFGQGWIIERTPLRFDAGWRNYAYCELFDRAVARQLDFRARRFTGRFLGFVGQALHSFRAARRQGVQYLELMAANSHVDNVARLHRMALRRYPFESSWLNAAQRRKTRAEYAAADRIYVASEYTRNSLVERGLPAAKLRKFSFTAHPRFRPPAQRADDGVFRLVYVGSLTVGKGVPLLVEAFNRLKHAAAELILVGGWSTRGMRRYLRAALAANPRIRIAPGDPLPHLQRASVCVHPSFEDGFGYAPAEALACGVPVIVTQDTGMKELVCEGQNGYIIQTGSVDELLDRLAHLMKHPLPAAS